MLSLFLPDQDRIPDFGLVHRQQREFVMLLHVPLIAIDTLSILSAQMNKTNVWKVVVMPND